MTITTDRAALYRLLAWLSPAYPVGAYSYSHGLETAVEDGLVRDRAALVAYVGAVLRAGAGRVDG
ncbi:MAG TPA: urease accessory protein UreF, partial [Crenalkalicoccus sp.]|nr:urease accessory protein UreF [Crenalkalicoccus sp.]